MRKIIIYIIILVQIMFIIPIIFTKKFEVKETVSETNSVNLEVIENNYNYKE